VISKGLRGTVHVQRQNRLPILGLTVVILLPVLAACTSSGSYSPSSSSPFSPFSPFSLSSSPFPSSSFSGLFAWIWKKRKKKPQEQSPSTKVKASGTA
jgi:hypothetical protein